MELRTGIEIEAAGLAAERATKSQLAAIQDAYEAIEQAIASGEGGIDQDFAFHCSIAAATGNPQFVSFLEYLGRFIIPRQTIQSADRRRSGGPICARSRTSTARFSMRSGRPDRRCPRRDAAAHAQQPQALPRPRRARSVTPVKTVLITGAAGDVGRRLARLLGTPTGCGCPTSRRRPDGAGDGVRDGRPRRPRRGRARRSRASTASSISAATRSRAVGDDSAGQHRRLLQPVRGGAARHGVERVVFASSNHAVGFYPPRPPDRGSTCRCGRIRRYGVSKAFGEAVGALYAVQARDAGDVPAHRQRGRCAGRPAPPVDLGQPGRSRPARPHRARPPRHQVRGVLRRLGERARLVGQFERPPLRLRPSGRGEAHRDAALAADAGRRPIGSPTGIRAAPFAATNMTATVLSPRSGGAARVGGNLARNRTLQHVSATWPENRSRSIFRICRTHG